MSVLGMLNIPSNKDPGMQNMITTKPDKNENQIVNVLCALSSHIQALLASS